MSGHKQARFQVFVRNGCHLCDDMLEQLRQLSTEHDFDLGIIDISGKPELEKAYGTKVPVLTYRQQEICHYYLDLQRFRELMGGS